MSALRRSCEAHVPPSGYHETPSTILPPAPPAELDSAIDAALSRAAALASTGREMHFDVGADGRLTVELRDLDGTVLKPLSPTQAVSLMGGLGFA
jgi:hypothetical protein